MSPEGRRHPIKRTKENIATVRTAAEAARHAVGQRMRNTGERVRDRVRYHFQKKRKPPAEIFLVPSEPVKPPVTGSANVDSGDIRELRGDVRQSATITEALAKQVGAMRTQITTQAATLESLHLAIDSITEDQQALLERQETAQQARRRGLLFGGVTGAALTAVLATGAFLLHESLEDDMQSQARSGSLPTASPTPSSPETPTPTPTPPDTRPQPLPLQEKEPGVIVAEKTIGSNGRNQWNITREAIEAATDRNQVSAGLTNVVSKVSGEIGIENGSQPHPDRLRGSKVYILNDGSIREIDRIHRTPESKLGSAAEKSIHHAIDSINDNPPMSTEAAIRREDTAIETIKSYLQEKFNKVVTRSTSAAGGTIAKTSSYEKPAVKKPTAETDKPHEEQIVFKKVTAEATVDHYETPRRKVFFSRHKPIEHTPQTQRPFIPASNPNRSPMTAPLRTVIRELPHPYRAEYAYSKEIPVIYSAMSVVREHYAQLKRLPPDDLILYVIREMQMRLTDPDQAETIKALLKSFEQKPKHLTEEELKDAKAQFVGELLNGYYKTIALQSEPTAARLSGMA